jgi:hypothetical protein
VVCNYKKKKRYKGYTIITRVRKRKENINWDEVEKVKKK